MCRGKGEEGILMVFLIEWNIKIHAKRELYWIVDLREKKIILVEALQDVEFSLSVYRPVALRPWSVVAQSCLDSGTCLRPCGRRIVHWVLLFVSLWYADKPDIKRGSHGDEKEPADTAEMGRREENYQWNSSLPWHILTRLHEAKLTVYEELIHKDQRERNINVFKGYSVINANTRMRFSLYCAGLRIVAGGYHWGR